MYHKISDKTKEVNYVPEFDFHGRSSEFVCVMTPVAIIFTRVADR